MKLQGKAYVVETELGKRVVIASATFSQTPLIIRSFGRSSHDDAENLCLSLNNWRESFADVTAKKFFNPETNEWEFRYDEK